jgi:uncharacterized membrane protein
MSKVMTALVSDAAEAAKVLEDLEHHGVPSDTISVITSEKIDVKDFVDLQWSERQIRPDDTTVDHGINSLVAGLTSVGVINHMDISVLGAGPLVAYLSAGRLGAASNNALGGLLDLGISQEEIQYVEHALCEGGVLIGVHVQNDDEQIVCRTFEEHNVQHVSAI